MIPMPGVYAGVVISTDDPQARRRVRLRIPQITGTAVSGWAEPVTSGTVSPGDQVSVAFEAGDPDFPLFWPPQTASPWTPLELASGWVAAAPPDGPPVCRVTADGMIELHGSAVSTTTPVRGANIVIGTLPGALTPLYDSYQMCASDNRNAYGARQAFASNNVQTTTTSTSYADLSGPSLTFQAPGSGEVVVTVQAWLRSSATGDTAYMSARLTLGSTVVLEADDDRAVLVTGTTYSASSSSFVASGLTPGSTYTLAARYRSATSTGSTATFDTRRLIVSPTTPFTSPHVRVGVLRSGSVTVLYPNGSAGTTVGLAGVRARAR